MNKIGIYKITNTVNGKFYIGSSRNIFHRWSKHKYDSKRISRPLYDDMREFGFDQFELTILEECSVDELKVREQYYIEMLKPEYNRCKAYTGIDVSQKEDAKAYAKEYKRKYQQEHKSEINEYQRNYYQANKEAISERKRNYYQIHKDELKERQRRYYQAHREEWNEYQREYRQAHKK